MIKQILLLLVLMKSISALQISGTVIDHKLKQPIKGAFVELRSYGEKSYTDEKGRFTFSVEELVNTKFKNAPDKYLNIEIFDTLGRMIAQDRVKRSEAKDILKYYAQKGVYYVKYDKQTFKTSSLSKLSAESPKDEHLIVLKSGYIRKNISTSKMKTDTNILIELVSPTNCPKYDRDVYMTNWNDPDGDCISNRHEVLIEENDGPAPIIMNGCYVQSGQWWDSYTGKFYTDPRDLQIDHVVPLSEVHKSGGWKWPDSLKEIYANQIEDSTVLLVVHGLANQAKGDKDPGKWLPSNSGYHKDYAELWIQIKNNWGLSYDSVEVEALENLTGNNVWGTVEWQEEYYCTNTDQVSSSTLPSSNASCCKMCTPGVSKACGDACISEKYNCSKPSGCACNSQ